MAEHGGGHSAGGGGADAMKDLKFFGLLLLGLLFLWYANGGYERSKNEGPLLSPPTSTSSPSLTPTVASEAPKQSATPTPGATTPSDVYIVQ